MTEESLNISTQIAHKEERARIQRLEERHKIMELFSQSITSSQSQSNIDSLIEDEEPLILDIDLVDRTPLIKVSNEPLRK